MKKIVYTLCLLLLCLLTSFKAKQITWVAIGDSITYMNEHPEETNNRITKGYMTMVTEKLPDVKYINQGHNGWTAGGIAENIDKLGLRSADVYTIFLGTNDWWASRRLGNLTIDYENNSGNDSFYGSYRIIINKLRSINPDARIILITPMQRADFVYIKDMKNNAVGSYRPKEGQLLEQFAEAVKKIGIQEGFEVIDLFNTKSLSLKHLVKFKHLPDPVSGKYKNFRFPDFIDIPFNPLKDEYPYPPEAMDVTYDGLHPTDKGYKIIADMVIKAIKH